MGMKRALALIFVLVFALAICVGCGKKTVDGDEYVYIHTKPTAEAELCTPVPATEEPTPAPTEEPTPVPTAAPTEPEQKGGSDGRRVYLTFDDGPNANTGRTLDILNSYGVKATFFTVGMCVERNPEYTKRIVNEGHLLACHTYSHDLNSIYKSTDAFLADIAKWRRVVINAVGWDAGTYYLRFPGGTTNTTIGGRNGRAPFVNAARAAGYHIYDWTMGTNDKWLAGNKDHLPVAEYLWNSYLDTYDMFVNTGKPLIILIHDDVSENLDILPRMIEDLMSKGCTFGTVDELGSDFLM